MSCRLGRHPELQTAVGSWVFSGCLALTELWLALFFQLLLTFLVPSQRGKCLDNLFL